MFGFRHKRKVVVNMAKPQNPLEPCLMCGRKSVAKVVVRPYWDEFWPMCARCIKLYKIGVGIK